MPDLTAINFVLRVISIFSDTAMGKVKMFSLSLFKNLSFFTLYLGKFPQKVKKMSSKVCKK